MQYLDAQRTQQLINGSGSTPEEVHNENTRLSEIRSPFFGEQLQTRLIDGRKIEVIPADQVSEKYIALIRNEARKIQLCYRSYNWAKKPFVEVVRYYRDKVRQGLFFVGLVNNYPAGIVGLSPEPSAIWESRHEQDAMYLSRMAILQAFRKKNLADGLIEWAKKVTVAEGFTRLRLDCNADSRLIAYYEKRGFVKIGEPDERRPSGMTPQRMEIILGSQ